MDLLRTTSKGIIATKRPSKETELEKPDSSMPFHPEEVVKEEQDSKNKGIDPSYYYPDDVSEKEETERPIENRESYIKDGLHGDVPGKGMRNFSSESDSKMRMYLEDGVIRYSKYGLASEKKAEELTIEEAFRGLRDSLWEMRRKYLKKEHPEVYKEIIYWENHLKEYNLYLGMKWLFGIPFGEYDHWVRRENGIEYTDLMDGSTDKKKAHIQNNNGHAEELKKTCTICGKELDGPVFKCPFCGEYLCARHILPKKHECLGLSNLEWDKYRKNIQNRYSRFDKSLNVPNKKEIPLKSQHWLMTGEDETDVQNFLEHLDEQEQKWLKRKESKNQSPTQKRPTQKTLKKQEKKEQSRSGMKCNVCGSEDSLYICIYCGKLFCEKHLLPMYHDCLEYQTDV